MIKLYLLHFIFLIFIIDVRAQVQRNSNNFQPSLPLVIGFLSIMFLLTLLLILYAKFRNRGVNVRNASLRIRDGLFRSRSSASGIDKLVIESLPFFRFSSLRGSRDGLECSVCLTKFEDVEILRLLPKCKHAFHIDCIDKWLEKHSTCPLCRRKITPEDVSESTYSNSLRFLRSQSCELIRDESNLELYVQREENGLGSSRFSIGRSFRFLSRGAKEGELPARSVDSPQFKKRFHRFNHRVVGSSDVVFKNRWSNVSSSDLVFLNSKFLNDASSARFTSKKSMEVEGIEKEKENDQMMSTIRQTGHSFLNFPGLPTTSDSTKNYEFESNFPYPIDKRSMSEIVVHPRFTEFEDKTDSFAVENSVESERIRRLWIPIARKTVQWFTNRESRPPNSQGQ